MLCHGPNLMLSYLPSNNVTMFRNESISNRAYRRQMGAHRKGDEPRAPELHEGGSLRLSSVAREE